MANSAADPNQNAYANAPAMSPDQIKRHSPGGDIYEALVKKLVSDIGQPTPPVPQYQPPQINPRQAYALAQNPKQSEQMMQYAAAPNQARYQNQLMAFQEAMGGQDKAMQLGTQLVGQQSRADTADLNRQLRTMYESGQLENQRTRNEIDRLRAQIDQTRANTAATSAANRPEKPPNLQVVNRIIATQKVSGELDRMEKVLDLANKTQGPIQRGIGAELTHTKEGQTPGTMSRIGSYVNPLAAEHEAARQRIITELGPLLTDQNRAIASIATRIEKSLPDLGTNPVVYKKTLSDLRALNKQIESGLSVAYPNEYKAATTSPESVPVPDLSGGGMSQAMGIPRSKFNTLPQSEQQRAINDGVQIIEGR